MTAHPKILDTAYFNNIHPQESGLILDYRDALNALPKDAGKDYIHVFDLRVKQGSFFPDKDAQKQRAIEMPNRILSQHSIHMIQAIYLI